MWRAFVLIACSVVATGSYAIAQGKAPQSAEAQQIRESFARANVARQKLWQEIRSQLGADEKTITGIPVEVRNEYRRHAIRVAKLQRIHAIAVQERNDRVRERSEQASKLEEDRHRKEIDSLFTIWKKIL